MVDIQGVNGISAKVLCDSISEAGIRFTTLEVTYPRLVLAEINTHRALSKCSSSSRAIPFAKMAENLTGRPVRFGAANPGMQDKGEDFDAPILDWVGSGVKSYTPEVFWAMCCEDAKAKAEYFFDAGYHKQVYNRLTEPFQMMKTVISATEWENFNWLRNDKAADPSLHELARCIDEARKASVPQLLKAGQWHLPYVKTLIDNQKWGSPKPEDRVSYWEFDDIEKLLTLEQAIKVSCARTAAVSFRNEDYGLEKCISVYNRLVGDERIHGSATEHCATPMADKEHEFGVCIVNVPAFPLSWEDGVSHVDREGNLWSGNIKGWVQKRKTIIGENHE